MYFFYIAFPPPFCCVGWKEVSPDICFFNKKNPPPIVSGRCRWANKKKKTCGGLIFGRRRDPELKTCYSLPSLAFSPLSCHPFPFPISHPPFTPFSLPTPPSSSNPFPPFGLGRLGTEWRQQKKRSPPPLPAQLKIDLKANKKCIRPKAKSTPFVGGPVSLSLSLSLSFSLVPHPPQPSIKKLPGIPPSPVSRSPPVYPFCT